MWTLSLCFLYVFKYWIESLHNRTQLRNHVWMDLGTCIIKVISIYRSVRQYVHIILAKMKDKQMTCQGMHDSWVRNVHQPTLLITDELWTQGWFFFFSLRVQLNPCLEPPWPGLPIPCLRGRLSPSWEVLGQCLCLKRFCSNSASKTFSFLKTLTRCVIVLLGLNARVPGKYE